MSILIDLVHEELPPTSNKIYFRGTQLTEKAKSYAERFSHAMRHWLYLTGNIDPGAIYALHLRFYFHELVNATWNNMNVPPSKRAKTRYKRIDLDNRIKLITDCVRDFIGVDDSQLFAGSQEKHQCGPGEKERVHLMLQRVEPVLFGL